MDGRTPQRFMHTSREAELEQRLSLAEKLLREIRDGKHSLPGTLVQVDRYFERQARNPSGQSPRK